MFWPKGSELLINALYRLVLNCSGSDNHLKYIYGAMPLIMSSKSLETIENVAN